MADPSIQKLTSFTFLVDSYTGLIRDLKKAPWGKQTSITADEISFALEGDDLVVDHHIDRLTGQLSGEGRRKKTQKPQSKLSGECEKVTVMGPKF